MAIARSVIGGAAAVALSALALVGAIPAGAGATGTLPEVGAKEVSITFISPTDHRRFLQLKLFPAKGVAVVDTYVGDNAFFVGRGVDYAIAIPPGPFDGSLDLKFPGLGEIVGTVTPDGPHGPAARAKLCESHNPEEFGTFEGRLAFRGAGGYGRWKASKAPVGIPLACAGEDKRENGSAALFDHVVEGGPPLDGPAPIRFSAEGEVRHRVIEFIAWGGRNSDDVEFVAIDREWLPGEVATERWVKQVSAALKKTVALESDDAGVASATITPPAPFFGKGTYRRSTGELTGRLGVSFLGLKLHVAPSPLTAALEDEELR